MVEKMMDNGEMLSDDEILIKDKVESVEHKQQMLKRQKFWRLRNEDGTPNYILLGGTVITLLVVIWAVWFIMGEIKLANSRLTKISNFWRYGSGMSETSENSVYAMLYNAIQINLPEGENPPHRGAKIREGSYKQEKVVDSNDVNNVWHSEFIVDIAKLRQSYRISVDWPLGGKRVFSNYYPEISCLSGDEVIYEDFQCKELPERFPGEKSNPARYLPHTVVNDETGEEEYTVRRFNNDLMVFMQTCGDAQRAKEYKAAASAWLDSTELDLEKYDIKYLEACSGGR